MIEKFLPWITQEWLEAAGDYMNSLAPDIPEALATSLFGPSFANLAQVLSMMAKTESPIEERFVAYLMAEALKRNDPQIVWAVADQFEPEIEGKRYRADFKVTARSEDGEPSVLIECDGHDFHEKTKEQARRDKSRDRALQSAGYHVLHFTGSEIWRDPKRCAHEVIDFLLKKIGGCE